MGAPESIRLIKKILDSICQTFPCLSHFLQEVKARTETGSLMSNIGQLLGKVAMLLAERGCLLIVIPEDVFVSLYF